MLKEWYIASRPWSLTAAIIPILVGAGYAWWATDEFRPLLFVLTLIGGILIQAGTNYINTYGDYMKGVDTIETAPMCPQLVTGAMKPQTMKMVGIACFAVAAAIGIVLCFLVGWPLLVVGIIGVLGGYSYTAGFSYKYSGLGTIFVFFLMGPLMVWGAYFVQTGAHSWPVVLVSLPVAFLVSSILHANDLRDLEFDQKSGIKTLATIINSSFNYTLYYLLISAAYAGAALLITFGVLPLECLLIFLTLPLGIGMIRQCRAGQQGNREKLEMLLPKSAQFHFQFGLVYFVGLLIAMLVQYLDLGLW
ncbi:MAG: 1,4-dihydroxy-2-naphthoate octaprenyltransferase [Coriobacteriia bacterium]|nr:1,4-dihydroxy-2-naphthoate octaprenyltransferase [Coriobacteriia bacterium]